MEGWRWSRGANRVVAGVCVCQVGERCLSGDGMGEMRRCESDAIAMLGNFGVSPGLVVTGEASPSEA